MMRFSLTTLQVEDLERSLHFYHDCLGLPLNQRFAAGNGGEIAMLGEPGAPQLELIGGREFAAPLRYEGFSIGFDVEDLDTAVAALAAQGFPLREQPFSPQPGIRLAFLYDPDGITVELVEYRQP